MAERDSARQATIKRARGKWSDAKVKYSREYTWYLVSGAN
jgi:hypothetical protein